MNRAPKHLLQLLVVVADAIGGGMQPAAADPCPGNRIDLTDIHVTSTRATLDTTGYSSRGSYDLRNGLLSSSVSFNDPGWTGSAVATDDEYWVVGLPAGTPVDFTAALTVSGSWNVYPGVPQGNFTYECSLAAGSDTAGFAVPPGGCCHANISKQLELPLHRLAQEPFRLRVHLTSQAYRGSVSESGSLEFTGLPPGAAVVSCQGYISDPIVGVGAGMVSPSAIAITEVHPNPASSDLALTIRLPGSAPARLDVFDLIGRRMHSRELRFTRPGSYGVRLDETRGLPPGLYTVRLEQEGRSAATTFLVTR